MFRSRRKAETRTFTQIAFNFHLEHMSISRILTQIQNRTILTMLNRLDSHKIYANVHSLIMMRRRLCIVLDSLFLSFTIVVKSTNGFALTYCLGQVGRVLYLKRMERLLLGMRFCLKVVGVWSLEFVYQFRMY